METGACGALLRMRADRSGGRFTYRLYFYSLGDVIMTIYSYWAQFEPGDLHGNIVVTFPDVPEAITQGQGEADARSMAGEALGLVLLTYLERGMPLPRPSAKLGGLVEISVELGVAAKLTARKTEQN